MLENKKVHIGVLDEDIYISRIIISWINSKAVYKYGFRGTVFEDWLKSLQISENDINDIYEMAINGKFELEHLARTYVHN